MRKLREPATGSTYVGLDVSLKETSICVLEDEGCLVGEAVVVSDPEAIAAAEEQRHFTCFHSCMRKCVHA